MRIILFCIVCFIVCVIYIIGSKFDCKKKYERIFIYSLFYRFKSFKVIIMEYIEIEIDIDIGIYLRFIIKICIVIVVSNKYNLIVKL